MGIEFLHTLETIRTPFLTTLMSLITQLGAETLAIALFCVFFFAVSKKKATFLMFSILTGILLNSVLKIAFAVPRPWVLDSTLHPVESALKSAGGYSFPSGHTSMAVILFGSLAVLFPKKKWFVAVCVVMSLLVSFSRLYLGVHTPLDVIASYLITTAALALVVFVFRRVSGRYGADCAADLRRDQKIVLITCLAILAYFLFLCFWPFREGDDPELKSGAYSCGGIALGGILGWAFERKYVHMTQKTPLWYHGVQIVVGGGLLLGIRAALKQPLLYLLGYPGNAVRYAVMIFVLLGIIPWLSEIFLPKLTGRKNPGKGN